MTRLQLRSESARSGSLIGRLKREVDRLAALPIGSDAYRATLQDVVDSVGLLHLAGDEPQGGSYPDAQDEGGLWIAFRGIVWGVAAPISTLKAYGVLDPIDCASRAGAVVAPTLE